MMSLTFIGSYIGFSVIVLYDSDRNRETVDANSLDIVCEREREYIGRKLR